MKSIYPPCQILFAVICAAFLCLHENQAFAQQPRNQFGSNYRNRPTVSPYLSLANNGGGNGNFDAWAYYNVIRPQQQGQKFARGFQKELHSVEQKLQNSNSSKSGVVDEIPITSGRMPPSGHGTAFGDLGSYYGGSGSSQSAAPANRFGRSGKRR